MPSTAALWAGLSPAERAALARKLANAHKHLSNAPPPPRRHGGDPLTGRLGRRAAAADMGVLYEDLTGREMPGA